VPQHLRPVIDVGGDARASETATRSPITRSDRPTASLVRRMDNPSTTWQSMIPSALRISERLICPLSSRAARSDA
jgi:hypothetical protein